MKRVLFSYGEGLYIDEYPDPPSPGDGEVLVELKYAGLCASDLHYMEGGFRYPKTPIVPGHEGSGVVREVGDGVDGLDVGDRVVIEYVSGCGECRECRLGMENRCGDAEYYGFELNGTFQEYMILPMENVVPLSKEIPLDVGAILGCAVVTPYHAIKAVGGVEDKDVAVIGLGGVGIHAILLAKLMKASTVIGVDIQGWKKKLAYQYGADHFINPLEETPIDKVRRITGDGVDVAFEFVGSPETVGYVFGMTRKGGISLLAGLINEEVPINFIDIISGERRIYGVEDHTHSDLKEVVELVYSNRLDLSKSITHRFSLEDVEEAIELLKKKNRRIYRIVLEI